MKRVAYFLCGYIFMFAACNAVKRVINDPQKTQKVVDAYLRNYPITNDTASRYLPGDTVTQVIIGYDTVTNKDTVTQLQERVVTRTVTSTRTIRDTLKIVITDNKAVQAAQKTLLVKEALLTAKDIQIKELRGDVGEWRLRFWLLVLAFALGAGFMLYLKFRPKL